MQNHYIVQREHLKYHTPVSVSTQPKDLTLIINGAYHISKKFKQEQMKRKYFFDLTYKRIIIPLIALSLNGNCQCVSTLCTR